VNESAGYAVVGGVVNVAVDAVVTGFTPNPTVPAGEAHAKIFIVIVPFKENSQ
jgi:hypothetical protein